MKSATLSISILLLTLAAHAQLAGPTNGGFESGLTGWNHQFGQESIVGGAHSGSNACRLTDDNGTRPGQLNSPQFAVEPGATYELSAWVKRESGDVGYMVAIAWLGGETVYHNSWAGGSLPTEWTEHGGTFTCPAGKTQCVIILGVATGGVALFDDIALTKVSGGGGGGDFQAKDWEIWAAPDFRYNANALADQHSDWAEARGLTRGYKLYIDELFDVSIHESWDLDAEAFVAVLAGSGVDLHVEAHGPGLDHATGEAAAAYELQALDKVYDAGGTIVSLVLDDPIGNILEGAAPQAGAGRTLAESTAALVDYMEAIHAAHPALDIALQVNAPQWTFDGHPAHFGADSWSTGAGYDLTEVLDAVFQAVSQAGERLAGLHVWNPYDYYAESAKEDPEKLVALEAYASAKGVPSGLAFSSGDTAALTDAQFHDQVLAMLNQHSQAGAFPDVLVVQSRYGHPGAYLPEKTPNTFMDTVRDFAYLARSLYPKAYTGAVSNMLLLDNGTIQIGMDLGSGGAITYMSLSGEDSNFINIHDRGREIQQSYYAGDVLNRQSEGQSSSWSPWPWNPIQVGDYAGNSSEIVDAWIEGDTAFTRCIPMLWDMNNEPAQAYMDQWTEIEGNVAHIRNRLVCWRDPDDLWNLVAARDQELPAVYTIADMPYLYTYTGDSPWTNGPLTEIDNDPNDGFIWDAFSASERWAANVVDRSGNGWGLGVYNRESTRWLGGLAGTVGGGPRDGSTAYISPLRVIALDRTSVFEYEYDLIVGTLNEIRQYVYDNPPDNREGWEWWQFNTDGDMEGWTAQQQVSNVAVSGGFLRFDITGGDPILLSPSTSIIASETPYIHVRMKNGTNRTMAQFFWTNTNGGPGTAGNDITFTLSTNDTEPKDYVIDMRQASGWTGVISQLRFDPVASASSGHMDVDYIAAWPTADPPVADETAPVITLVGDAEMTIDCDTAFNEPGYAATDDVDGVITGRVVVGGDAIDGATPAPGTYTITYDVQDSAGNDAVQRVRTVHVTTNCASYRCGHAADVNHDCVLQVEELVRCVQIYNAGAYRCGDGDDGFAPGTAGTQDCGAHTADYVPQDWSIALDELMRVVQLYDAGGLHACETGEDGYCLGAAP